MEAHTFSPCSREVETGSDMAGERQEYRVGGDRSSGFSRGFVEKAFSLRIHRDRILPYSVRGFSRGKNEWLDALLL